MANREPTSAKARSPEPYSAWERAAAHGIDMSLIEENLRKTPAERLAAHASALALAWQFREAGGRRATEPARSA